MSAPSTKSKLNRTALVVFSGGQDSTTCLHWALGAFASVEAIYFDYGQRHASEERAAQTIAWQNQVPLRRFRLDFFRELGGNALTDSSIAIEAYPPISPPLNPPPSGGDKRGGKQSAALPNTFVPGRNLLFLTQAASYAYTRGIRDVVTGVCETDFSGYPDCRHETLRALQRALHLGLGWPERRGIFRIHTPLMFRTKAESVALARRWGALESLALSHTCYEGAFPPCGKCPSCLLRAKGFAEAGMDDPLILRASALATDTPESRTES